ncbi:hypothetical protein [Parasphingorhabdus sp.]|uniref:hypothetical protein n=1 Tax=Parasphingorhabdus sp. TaxID=2709688 RepID=UPI0032649B69
MMNSPRARKNDQQQQAVQQKMLLLVRLSGLIFLIGGLAIIFGVIGSMDIAIGYVLAVVGLVDLLIVPMVIGKMFTRRRDKFLEGNRPDNRPGR